MLDPKKLHFKNTAGRAGRRAVITPRNSPLRHLHYGRIILRKGAKRVTVGSDTRETGLMCMSGKARLRIDGRTCTIKPYDSVYLARGSRCEIDPLGDLDLIEASARAERKTRSVVVPFEEVQRNPKLVIKPHQEPSYRTIHITVGDNVEADRLVFGVTFSKPGNWTSWPPHEHAKAREELYVYFGIPKPSYGIQLIYDNPRKIHAIPVEDGDAVVIPRGYHPNVACPTTPMNFVWIMAAHRAVRDRGWHDVSVQPGFRNGKK